MSDPRFTDTQRRLILALYGDAVLEAVMDGDSSTGHVKEIQSRNMPTAIRAGSFTVDIATFILSAGWEVASDHSSNNTNRLIKEINDGAMTLDFPEWLDSPVTIGNVRRTTIKFMQPEDWPVIVDVRKKHRDDSDSVYASANNAANIAMPMMDAFGSMEHAVTKGGMLLIPPAKGIAV